MARLLDYQFDNFSTDANGNHIIVNAGTLGSANDAIMYTGQGLEFDGVDDYIKTPFYWSPSDNVGQVRGVFKTILTYDETLYQNIAGAETANASPDYVFSAIYDGKWMVYSNGLTYGNAVTPNTFYRTCTIVTSATVELYVDGNLECSHSMLDLTGNDTPLWIGTRAPADQTATVIPFKGIQSNVIYVDKTPTADDIAYDAQHPEALLNMVLTGTDNPNFSFGVSNIILCAPLMKGTGNTVYNVKDSSTLAMSNFPTDDTQWTNANEQSALVQKEKYITNNYWVISKIGPAQTIRAVPVPMIGVFKTTSDNEDVTLPVHTQGYYDFKIEWGDGTVSYITDNTDIEKTHTYTTAGEYTFTISGKATFWPYGWAGTPQHLYKMLQFGNLHLTDFNRIFANCTNLVEFNLGAIGEPTQLEGSASYCFSGVQVLPIDLHRLNFSKCSDVSHLFDSATIDNVDFTKLHFENATNISYFLYNCNSELTSKIADCSNFNLKQDITFSLDHFAHNASCYKIIFPKCKASSASNLCAYVFSNVKIADVSLIDTSACVSFSYAFRSFNGDQIVGMENWDTSSVTDISYCFAYCDAIPDSIQDWDVSSVTTADGFMSNRSITTAVYDQLLIKWGAQTVQSGVTIDFGSSQYTPGGDTEAGRQSLINQGWTIIDGGPAA